MKLFKIFKLLIPLLLLSVCAFSQTSAPIRAAAKLNVSVASGGDPYTLTVSVLDDLSRFSFADFGVGDSVYLIDGSDLLVYVITSKLTSPNRLVVDDVNNTGISAPTGQGAIVKSTPNYKLPFYISGLRDDLRSMMMNRLSQLLDSNIATAGSEVYRYVGSTGVAPAVTAAAAGAITAQNTVGEIYTWNPATNLASGAWSIVSGGGGGSVDTLTANRKVTTWRQMNGNFIKGAEKGLGLTNYGDTLIAVGLNYPILTQQTSVAENDTLALLTTSGYRYATIKDVIGSKSICYDTITATGLNLLDRVYYNGSNWVAVTDTLQPATFVVIKNLGSTYQVASCGNIYMSGLPAGVTYLYASNGSGQPSTTVRYAGYLYGIAVDGVLQIRINQPIVPNSSGGSSGWGLTGTSGTTAGTNFVGTTDAQALVFKANNTEGFRITTGGNLAIGTTTATKKLVVAGSDITINSVDIGLGGNSEASSIRVGANALGSITSGIRNVGIGLGAMGATTSGGSNVALGWNTMAVNTIGGNNVAVGAGALTYNTTGGNNVGIGANALVASTTSSNNVAVGSSTLAANTTGAGNTGFGQQALLRSVSGSNNLAVGFSSGQNVKTGSTNTLIGYASNFYYSQARDSSLNNTLVLGTYNRMVMFSDSTSKTCFGCNTPASWIDVEGNLSVGANYSGSVSAPTNGAIIEGNVGIGTSTVPNRLTVDALSTGNPLKLTGVVQGANGDSVATFLNGVMRQMAMKDVTKYRNYTKITGNYTVLAADMVIAVENEAATVTITFPQASAHTNRVITVKRLFKAGGAASTGTITITPTTNTTSQAGNIEALDGTFGASVTLAANGVIGANLTYISNGAEWELINN